jgi:HD-GYP domain-containing protein (c-di-GMP phosphodiesterase class II)
LTDEEFKAIKKHPAEGERIMAAYSPFKEMLAVVRSHHERFDGKGYPDGLAGENISMGARVIAVADSFDAMISNRTYRQGLGFDRTIEEIKRGKNTQFDGQIVDALLRLIEKMGQEAFEEMYCNGAKKTD